MKTLLTVGPNKFARNASALVDTLFSAGGTASGMFRARKNSILFLTPAGEPFACLVANPNSAQFFVSAFKQSDGRTRYAFALSNADAKTLGVAGMKYSEESDEAARVWDSIGN